MSFYRIIVSFGFIIIGSIFFVVPTIAEESGGGSSFYVKAIMPDKQLPDTSEYFHIQTDSDLKQILEIAVVNDSQENKSFHIEVLDGMTTDSGEIGYDINHLYNETQTIRLSNQSKFTKTIIIPSNESVVVPIEIDFSIGKFTGQILGAINVSEEKETRQNSSGVVNQFAYNIPIKIDVKTSQIEAKLDYNNIEVFEDNKHSFLKMNFSNPSATIIRDLTLTYWITDSKGNEIVNNKEKKEIEIAPNSLFAPRIDINDTSLKSGKYKIVIQAKSDISNINEKWTDHFILTSKEARAINEGFSVTGSSIPTYIWIVIILVCLALLGFIYRKYKSK